MGVCVWCGAQRDNHPKAGQARSSGKVTPISRPELVFADSPISAHPDIQSPASNAAKVRPDIVFCRHCNQGMGLKGRRAWGPEETQYPCPKCHLAGPKSKTMTGKPQAASHEQPAPDRNDGPAGLLMMGCGATRRSLVRMRCTPSGMRRAKSADWKKTLRSWDHGWGV